MYNFGYYYENIENKYNLAKKYYLMGNKYKKIYCKYKLSNYWYL